MRRLYTAEQFAKLTEHERDAEGVSVATASLGEPEFGDSGRTVRYVFSTPAVGRDMHTVAADAWELGNFKTNPVFLWAHDDTQPPIGRVIEIGDVNGVLRGTVEYADRDLNPFADMIYRLVKGRYLNAVSTSWAPLEWTFSRDKSRPGGIDFRKVDCLEISQVPLPALPQALATARSSGIDTGPLFVWAEKLLDTNGQAAIPRQELETLRRAAKMPAIKRSESAEWKVGAAKDLPIEDSDSWDGSAAEKSIFEWAGGDEFDSSKARRGFLVYDSANPDKRGSYKLPIAHAVDGELKVPKGAIRAAASRLPQTDIPESVKNRAEAVLNAYKKKAGIGEDDDKEDRALNTKLQRALERAPKVPTFRRGLYEVANLACLVESLGYCHNAAEWETEFEGDDSTVPGMLGEALVKLGEALVAMTDEEVKELLAAHDDEDEEDGEEMERALTPATRAAIAQGKTAHIRAWRRGVAIARAGKSISVSNQKKLEEADGHHDRAMKHHRAMADQHEALGNHMDAAQEHNERATETLSELGEHLRAIQNPDTPANEADAHIEAAVKFHRATETHHQNVADAHAKADETHEDMGDSHRCMGRSVKRAQSCVRAVLDGANPSEDGDEDGEGNADKKEAERAAKAREARAARARELARQHREPITLD